MTNPAQGGGSTFRISGTVTNASAQGVPGGVVKLYNSLGAIVDSQVPDGTGYYEFTGLSNGTYYPMLHPPLGYCLKSTEAGAQSVVYSNQGAVVVSGGNQSRPFDVVRPIWYEDYNFADTAALRNTSTGFGNRNWLTGWNGDQSFHADGLGTAASVAMDATGGSAGQPCQKWTVPSLGSAACSPGGGNQKAVGLECNTNTQGAQTDEIWLRFRRKMSANFEFGYPGCPTHSYKYQLFYLGSAAAIGGRVMMEIQWNGSSTDHRIHVQFADSSFWYTTGLDGMDGRRGSWLTWVLQISGIGGTTTCNVYLNGALTPTMTGSGTFNPVLGSGAHVFRALTPLNWDNGPENLIEFWDEEVQVSATRPNMLDGRAV